MRSYLEHVPEGFHEALRDAIEAVTETKILLDQVRARFGTTEPAQLRDLLGQTFDGYTVTVEAVAELEGLAAEHEARREACRQVMVAAGQGPLIPGQDLAAPEE